MSLKNFFRTHTLIAGTLFLTAAGLLSRVLGFFYRIYLSRIIGAEGLGIYQMVFPVYGICFSLCAGSIQTAISRFTAADPPRARHTLFTGFVISFSIAMLLSLALWTHSDFIAIHILKEPRCAPLLPPLSLAVPCTAVHACICGYYYGKEQVQIPATAQLLEQCIRIFSVFLIATHYLKHGREITVLAAVSGLVVGEAASAVFSLSCFLFFHHSKKSLHTGFQNHSSGFSGFLSTAGPLMALALPLMANRLVMNLLQSAEAILIPNQLTRFGLTQSQSLSIYGVLTGMAMPFILFPSSIVNSLAVILLPSVARYQSEGNTNLIEKNLYLSFRCSLYMGILCIGIFTVFGEDLGILVFQNKDAGTFITILAWLCPFLYLATTTSSVLNGLGKTTAAFIHHLLALLVRLGFVYFGIPKFGILAVLWGMLAGELFLAVLHLNTLRRQISAMPDVRDILIKPIVSLVLALGIYFFILTFLPLGSHIPAFFALAIKICLVSGIYGLFLLLFHR